jgi:hypothetical protein
LLQFFVHGVSIAVRTFVQLNQDKQTPFAAKKGNLEMP